MTWLNLLFEKNQRRGTETPDAALGIEMKERIADTETPDAALGMARLTTGVLFID